MKSLATYALSIAITAVAVSGCLQNTGSSSSKSATSTGTISAATVGGASGIGAAPTQSGLTFQMTNISVSVPTGASGASGATGVAGPSAATFTLFFNANNLSHNLNDVCSVQNGGGANNDPSKSCSCQFAYDELNVASTSNIHHVIKTAPSQISNFQVICPAPDIYTTDEIRIGTQITVSLLPEVDFGNNSGFVSSSLIFTKAATTATGDFRDSEGRSYKNIFHYVCYDKMPKSLGIDHVVKSAGQNTATNTAPVLPVANNFSVTAAGFSAESYFYDFYVRSTSPGSIVSGNQFFTCPQVNLNGTTSYYPMDSSFALALQTSADFPQQISSSIILAPSAGAPAGQANDVLGFAAKPNADGSCPSFTDSSGKIRRTFRLRNYRAIYPIRYDATGEVVDTRGQASNSIYILDRPVNKAGQDPLKPVTRLGPKPCPFSFKTQQFGQKCSTDASLAGTNVDGMIIPGNPSCPVYPPVPANYAKDDGSVVIRPYKPFLPHYIEDATFRACAFQSSIAIDPEIILSHDDGVFPSATGPNDFYCAKHYPSPGAVIPPGGGDPFDKPPGDCDIAAAAAAIKTDKTYACSRTFDPSNSLLNTPSAGCCQICSGPDCTAQGGGKLARGRNAAFTPPSDAFNPPQSINQLNRGSPNTTSTCFDPYEN